MFSASWQEAFYQKFVQVKVKDTYRLYYCYTCFVEILLPINVSKLLMGTIFGRTVAEQIEVSKQSTAIYLHLWKVWFERIKSRNVCDHVLLKIGEQINLKKKPSEFHFT